MENLNEYLDKEYGKPLYDYLKNGNKYSMLGHFTPNKKLVIPFFDYVMSDMPQNDFDAFSKEIRKHPKLGGKIVLRFDYVFNHRMIECYSKHTDGMKQVSVKQFLQTNQSALFHILYTDFAQYFDSFMEFINKEEGVKWLNGKQNLTADNVYMHPSIMKPQWLVHFTGKYEYALDICKHGFTRGLPNDKLDKIGYTYKNFSEEEKNGNFSFAYKVEDVIDGHFSSNSFIEKDKWKFDNMFDQRVWKRAMQCAVMFKSSGVEAFHHTDVENQVIFNNKMASDFVLLCRSVNTEKIATWNVMTLEGDSAYSNESLTKVIAWVVNNFDQYRKQICWSHTKTEGVMNKKIKITETQEKLLIKEAMQGGFSFLQLKQMPSFKGRLQYCKEHFGNPIGRGSSRICFQIDDQWILKLAMNRKGIAQNEYEGTQDYYKQRLLPMPKINEEMSDSDNFTYLVSEYVLPANEDDFEEALGESFSNVVKFINCVDRIYNYSQFNRNNKDNEEWVYSLIEENEWFNNFYQYMTNYQPSSYEIADMRVIKNWGIVMRDGVLTPVLLDSGYNADIAKRFYMRENHELTENIKIHKGENGRKYSTQGKWDKEIDCPHCGKKAYFSMSISDGERGRGRIKVTNKEGKEEDSEVQTIALYYCPHCYRFIARNNMA